MDVSALTMCTTSLHTKVADAHLVRQAKQITGSCVERFGTQDQNGQAGSQAKVSTVQ